ncbi:membrane protein insertion efficiency factor YidD [Candidatus Uhrbacteria bacterium]|nr:membrane protein insertion efficiency factor YidD [Candidatus Uhrbacteria bacterium]
METRFKLATPAVWILVLYQHTLSPDHGPMKRWFGYGFCRFHPTCSQYAIESLRNRGLMVGGFLAIWRVMRCHPFSRGGIDPPPGIARW